MISSHYDVKPELYKKTKLSVRILHVLRELHTKNSIFSLEHNLSHFNDDIKDILLSNDFRNSDTGGKIAILDNYFLEEEQKLKDIIKEKTKQQSKQTCHIIETCISFNEEDTKGKNTKELLEQVKKYYDEQNVKIYDISIHYDEGHIDENGKYK